MGRVTRVNSFSARWRMSVRRARSFRAPKRWRRRSRRAGGDGTYVHGIRTPTDVPLTAVPFPCVHDDTGRESADAEECQAGVGGGMGPGRAESGGRRPVAGSGERRGGPRSGRGGRAAPVRGGAVAADRGGAPAVRRSRGQAVERDTCHGHRHRGAEPAEWCAGPGSGGGVSVLPGIAFAIAVLRGFSSAEARNWFDR